MTILLPRVHVCGDGGVCGVCLCGARAIVRGHSTLKG